MADTWALLIREDDVVEGDLPLTYWNEELGEWRTIHIRVVPEGTAGAVNLGENQGPVPTQ